MAWVNAHIELGQCFLLSKVEKQRMLKNQELKNPKGHEQKGLYNHTLDDM